MVVVETPEIGGSIFTARKLSVYDFENMIVVAPVGSSARQLLCGGPVDFRAAFGTVVFGCFFIVG